MANVAVLAAGYMIQKMRLRQVGEVPGHGHFDIQAVEVRKGVVARPRQPRSLLFSGVAGAAGPKVSVFIGEAQPATGAYSFANSLIEKAREIGADRVVTFASMASQMHPSQQSRVFGAATHAELVDEIRKLEVQPLDEGQIAGLNGVLLGAASEQGLSGMCLMGEVPFFGVQLPNPKAARAVLDAFALLAGFEIDLLDLDAQGRQMDKVLLDMLHRMEAQAAAQRGEDPEFEPDQDAEDSADPDSTLGTVAAEPAEPTLDLSSRTELESLFEAARNDHAQTAALKAELDRLGVFKDYENRFLDLFKRAG